MEIQKIFSEIDTNEKLYSVSLTESEYQLFQKIFARIQTVNPRFGKDWAVNIWKEYTKKEGPKFAKYIKNIETKNNASILN